MKNKTFLLPFFVFYFLLIHLTGSYAFLGQLETKRERREREAASSSLPPDAYERIQESFLREDFAATVRLSENYLSKGNAAASDDVLYLEALSLLKLNRTSEARDKLNVLQNSTRSEDLKVSAAVSTGDSYYLANDTFLAIQSYEWTLKKYPNAPEAPYVQSRLEELSKKLVGGRVPNNVPIQNSAENFSASPVPVLESPKTISLHQAFAEAGLFYTVQVGSFSRERNARELMQKLTLYNYDAYLDSRIPERLYRVRVGKFATREDALRLELRLKKDGYPTRIYP